MSDAKYTKELRMSEATIHRYPMVLSEHGKVALVWHSDGVFSRDMTRQFIVSAKMAAEIAMQILDRPTPVTTSAVLLPADTLAKMREALEMGAKLAQAQHVAKAYGACTDALSLLASAQKQGEGES